MLLIIVVLCVVKFGRQTLASMKPLPTTRLGYKENFPSTVLNVRELQRAIFGTLLVSWHAFVPPDDMARF